jgi:hypothetical protein
VALSQGQASVESYIDNDGRLYLYTKPQWGTVKVHGSLPRPMFVSANSNYEMDGQWWDSPMPLSNDTMHATTESPTTSDEQAMLIDTRGPGVEISNNVYIPSSYRVICAVPDDIKQKIRIVNRGIKVFGQERTAVYEQRFWDGKTNELAWKHVRKFLPPEIPKWEMDEAFEVWSRGTAPRWMASVSLAASRKHYFENRKNYTSWVLGRDETAEERSQRLDFARDARLMAAFYRAFTDVAGKLTLLRKAKTIGATRIVNRHDRGYKEVEASFSEQFTQLQAEVTTWITAQYAASEEN